MCRHPKSSHTELRRRQRRLDARGNDVETTNRESDWAIELTKSFPPDATKLLSDHILGLCGNYKAPDGPTMKAAIEALADTSDDPWALASVLMDNTNGFKGLIDSVGARMPKSVDEKYARLKQEHPSLDQDRGRDNAIRIRQDMVQTRHAGITLSTGRSALQENALVAPIEHGVAKFAHSETSPTIKALVKQGAPFVGGTSGTLRFILQEWDTSGGEAHTVNPGELANREKLIGMHTTLMMVAGHHSASECLLMAQAYGYFADVPSPLKDYDGAMKGFEAQMRKHGLRTVSPLSRERADGGKSREELAYEAERNEVLAQLEKLDAHQSASNRRVLDRHLTAAANLADDGDFARARDCLGDVRAHLAYTRERVLERETRSPAVLTPDELVAKFGGRAPHRSKKKSVAYKGALASLDAYHASYKTYTKTTLSSELSFNAFRELREQLTEVEDAANAYVRKHGEDRSKAAEVGAMRALLVSVARERDLLRTLDATAHQHQDADGVTLEQAILLQRTAGLQFSRPGVLAEKNLNRKECRHLGSGGINQVQKLVYEPPNAPKVVRVFKREDPTARVPQGPREIGIEPGNPGFARRNVATRKAAEGLGLAHLVPDAEIVIVDGRPGLAMELVKGHSLETDEEEEVLGGASDDDVLRYNLRRDEVSGRVFTTRKRPTPVDLESDPDVDAQYQKQMIDLQWLDALCGQIDRHERNYLIEVKGDVVTVKAIDNDFSFGKAHTGVEKLESGGAPGNLGVQFCGLPPLIDGALFDNLSAMTIKRALGEGAKALEPGEIAAAEARLNELKEHAGDLAKENLVVRDWAKFRTKDDQTAKDFLLGAKKGNYYKRDIKLNRQNQAQKT